MKKPMLAAKMKDFGALRFPLFVSPKLDGIRCFVEDEDVLSRKRKLIPNYHVQKTFGLKEMEGVDGELIVGRPNAPDVFTKTTSGCMTREFEGQNDPDVRLFVFDLMGPETYEVRWQKLRKLVAKYGADLVVLVEQTPVFNKKELMRLEEKFTKRGYEGIMLRDPNGLYKYGRATFKSQALIKLKRFTDAEARVVGWLEEMSNQNPKKRNELGKMKRSSHKAGKVPKGVLGKLVVKDLKTGVQFKVGTGFKQDEREKLWKMRSHLKNKIIKYRFQPVGVKNKPRIPVFLGFRSRIDL